MENIMSDSEAAVDRNRGYKWIAKEIERLDPEKDFAEIWRLSTTYYVSDFVMNLVYTLGIPAFTQPPAGSVVMGVTTEKAIKKPQKRADDTLQHFWVWFEYGPDDPRMQASLAHVNRGHAALAKRSPGTFPARDVIYTTAWIGANLHRLRLSVGLPGFTKNQQIASQRYWAAICQQFWSEDGLVTEYPESFEAMLQYIEEYEAQPWEQVESGRMLTEAIIKQFVDAFFPGPLGWIGRQLYLSFQLPSINRLMQSGKPNPVMKWLMSKGLWLGLTLQERVFPDPKLSTPEKARRKAVRPGQHIDPPTAEIKCPFPGAASESTPSPVESGCPFHAAKADGDATNLDLRTKS
ncbi:DUF2236 domain-containing protein (plasmid) [Pseudomonas koreensis]|nr:DUF2236 domain-containing protein [Pseudomonas koreensis]